MDVNVSANPKVPEVFLCLPIIIENEKLIEA